MPPEVAAILRKERGRADIHENDAAYMEKVYNTYKELAQRYQWATVNCAAGHQPRSTTDILEDILRLVEDLLIQGDNAVD